MLADPQSVTINGVPIPLPKTNNGPTQNVFTSADGNVSFTAKQNSTATRFRREVRISQQKIAADPISATNKAVGLSVYLVIDEPRYGFSDTEIDQVVQALKAWATSANVGKITGGEF